MTDRLAAALKRVEDFNAVQANGGPDELEAAVLCLQQAVGIDQDSRVVLCEGIERISSMENAGGILLGLIVGLLAAQEAN